MSIRVGCQGDGTGRSGGDNSLFDGYQQGFRSAVVSRTALEASQRDIDCPSRGSVGEVLLVGRLCRSLYLDRR